MSDMLSVDDGVHSTPQACINDLTPPTFAGISSLSEDPNGSLVASWLAGSDATPPLTYEVYLQAASSVGLFSPANLVAISKGLSARVFTDGSGAYLVKGTTYHVGVRAVDAVGNQESNAVSLTAVSAGVLSDDLIGIARLLLSSRFCGDSVTAQVRSERVFAIVQDSDLDAVVE